MQPILDIPAPLEGDPDSVVTALETAAIFAAKGDAAEALRWVKRAAESSGDTGDDVRTLTLARTAADLNRHVQEARAAEGAAASAGGKGASETPRPSGISLAPRPGSATQTPTPTSSRVAGAASILPQPSTSTSISSQMPRVTASQTPVPSTASHPPEGVSPDTASVPPRSLPKPPARQASFTSGLTPENPSSRPPPPSSRPVGSSLTPRTPSTTNHFAKGVATPTRDLSVSASGRVHAGSSSLNGNGMHTSAVSSSAFTSSNGISARNSKTPSPPGVTSLSATPLAPTVVATKSIRPSQEHQTNARADGAALRKAARVSVVTSSTEPGLYLVRVLEEGKPTPADAAEGLLVLVDPQSTVFDR